MPRYYFDVDTGRQRFPDDAGSDLAGLTEARREALGTLSDLDGVDLGEPPGADLRTVVVVVRDADRAPLLKVSLERRVEAATAAPSLGAPRVRVLVLEDVAMIAFALADVLDDAGYRVVGPFASVGEALVGLREGAPDLALIDHVIDGRPCDGVAEALGAAGVPFLVHSGRTRARDALAPFVGVPWLSKPASAERLVAAMASLREGAATRA